MQWYTGSPKQKIFRVEKFLHTRRVQKLSFVDKAKLWAQRTIEFFGTSEVKILTTRNSTRRIMNVTDQSFEKDVLQASKPVLVDFWATWCGPCLVQGPIVEEVANAVGDKANVLKLNVDENPTYAQKYGIMSIPTIMIFKSGAVVKQFIGVTSKETLVGELNKLAN